MLQTGAGIADGGEDLGNHLLALKMNPAHPIWTEIEMVFDLKTTLWKNLSFFSKSKMAVGGPELAKFDHTNHISARHFDRFKPNLIKFFSDIPLDPRNESAEESKMASVCQWQKISQN